MCVCVIIPVTMVSHSRTDECTKLMTVDLGVLDNNCYIL